MIFFFAYESNISREKKIQVNLNWCTWRDAIDWPMFLWLRDLEPSVHLSLSLSPFFSHSWCFDEISRFPISSNKLSLAPEIELFFAIVEINLFFVWILISKVNDQPKLENLEINSLFLSLFLSLLSNYLFIFD